MKTETEALARRISGESLLEQFLLVGGTALSVYLEHRLSEDLDFATSNEVLPRELIYNLLERLSNEGCSVENIIPMAARDDAINDGIDLSDHHQDWLIDGVKLTFFTIQKDNGREKLTGDHGTIWYKKLRIASLDTLFITKSLVLADRHAMRDNYDMRALLEWGKFTYDDIVQAYIIYRPDTSLDIAKSRLRSMDYPLTDPGLSSVVNESEEETIQSIHVYFSDLIKTYEHTAIVASSQ